MAKFRSQKNSLIAGELSPTAHGRTDLPQYAHGCKLLRNMIPLLGGGAYRRPGTFFETSYDAATKYAPRLIDFVASKTEAYCLVFSKTSGGAGFVDAIRPSANNSTSTVTPVSGSHPYLPATIGNANGSYDELQEIQYVQSVDVLYLVHPLRIPQRVTRTAIDTFAIADFDSGLTGTAARDCRPYRAQNTSAITLAISNAAVGTGRTLTASAALFSPSHVGAWFKMNDGAGTIGACKVTAYISATQVTVQNFVAFGDTAAHTTWWESSWSDYRGWPRSICFHEQRLGYGGNAAERDSAWFSQSNNYDVMSVSTVVSPISSPTGTQPFQITLSSQQRNLIQWMSPDDTLLIGTMGDEFVVDMVDATLGFQCGNVKANAKTHYGSAYSPAQRFGNEVAFCLQSENEVRSLVFNQLQNAYIAEPLQTLFDEKPEIDLGPTVTRKFRNFKWDETRKTLWCSDLRGNLFGMTRDRSLQVTAWNSHQMGGYDSTKTGGTIGAAGTLTIDPAYYTCAGSAISMAVVPNPTIGFNDLWLAVKRKINGSWKYHVERLIGGVIPNSSAYETVSNSGGNYYVDACAYAAGAAPTLNHLEGETPHGTAYSALGLFEVTGSAVSGGTTTIVHDPPDFGSIAYTVAMGLPFGGIVIPLRPEAGSVIGSAQGALKRVHEVHPRFYRTIQGKIGKDSDNLETLIFRTGDQAMNKSPELFTGDKRVSIACDYDYDGYIYFLFDAALPACLVSFAAEGMTYD